MKMNDKRKEAYKLVVIQGIQQKEVAKILGVAENTVCRWAKTYGWKTNPIKLNPTVEGIVSIMSDICKIDNNRLRNSISDKLMKMISMEPVEED